MEHICLNWACTSNLSKTQFMAERRAKCQFDSQPLKFRNHPYLLTCRWHATYRWKDLDEGYNFASNLTSIKVFHKKLWASKVVGVPISKISKIKIPISRILKVRVLGQNDIWLQAPCPSTKNIIKGKVVVSSKFGSCWVLWVRVCSWFVRAPKVFQLCTNQLVV